MPTGLVDLTCARVTCQMENHTPASGVAPLRILCRTQPSDGRICAVKVEAVQVTIQTLDYLRTFPMRKLSRGYWSFDINEPCLGEFSFYFLVSFRSRRRISLEGWSALRVATYPRQPDEGFLLSSIRPTPAQGIGRPYLHGLPDEGETLGVYGIAPQCATRLQLSNRSPNTLTITSVSKRDWTPPLPGMSGGDSGPFVIEGLPTLPLTLQCLDVLAFDIRYGSTRQNTAYLVISSSVGTFEALMSGKCFIPG